MESLASVQSSRGRRVNINSVNTADTVLLYFLQSLPATLKLDSNDSCASSHVYMVENCSNFSFRAIKTITHAHKKIQLK